MEGIEILIDNLPIPEGESNISIAMETINVWIQRISNDSNDKERLLNLDNSHSVFFPNELTQVASKHSSSPTVSLLVHKEKSLFLRRNQNDLLVDSDIVSASIQQLDIMGLIEPVVITLNPNVSNF